MNADRAGLGGFTNVSWCKSAAAALASFDTFSCQCKYEQK
jgi:hypothetical protein